jgi:pectate lyase
MNKEQKYLIGAVSAIAIIVLLFIIPINSNKDISIDVTIHKPLIADAYIVSGIASSSAHTILSTGGILDDVIGITTSGNLEIVAECNGKRAISNVGEITRTTSETFTLKIKDVPSDASTVTITLLENSAIKDVKEIIIYD